MGSKTKFKCTTFVIVLVYSGFIFHDDNKIFDIIGFSIITWNDEALSELCHINFTSNSTLFQTGFHEEPRIWILYVYCFVGFGLINNKYLASNTLLRLILYQQRSLHLYKLTVSSGQISLFLIIF